MKKGLQLIQGIRQLLNDSEFIKRSKVHSKDFVRSRKLVFSCVIIMLLRLMKRSLMIECELMSPQPNIIPPSKQAFSKARYKLKPTAFKEIHALSNKIFYSGNESYGCFKGYRLIAADGSSMRLPESKALAKHFGRFACNKTEGKRPLLARISLFVDLSTGMILDGELTSWGTGERAHAKKLLPGVVNQMKSFDQNKPLFIYDRGYFSRELIAQHRALGCDFLFRLQRRVCRRLWSRVEAGETDFITFVEGEEDKIRVVAIKLRSGEMEVLITSLLDQSRVSYTDIVGIYALRWQIEECYKRLKISAELENFSGKRVEAIQQEFWAHLAMCNILSTHMKDEQPAWVPNRLPTYRLNFTFLFGVTRMRLQEVLSGNCTSQTFEKLFQRAVPRAKTKVRPNRQFSRQNVNKPKRHHIFRRAC